MSSWVRRGLTTKYRHDAHPTSAWSFFVIERSKGPAVVRAVALRFRLCDNDRLTLHALFTSQETRMAMTFLGALSNGLSVTNNKEDGRLGFGRGKLEKTPPPLSAAAGAHVVARGKEPRTAHPRLAAAMVWHPYIAPSRRCVHAGRAAIIL